MDIRDRLASVIEAKGLTVNRFASTLSVTRTAVYDVVGGKRNKPSADMLASIASAYPDINIGWLLTGQGEMLASKEVEKSISMPISAPSPNQDLTLKKQAVTLQRYKWTNQAKVTVLKGISASAGKGIVNQASANTNTEVTVPGLLPSAGMGYLAVTVDGDSMVPTLHQGELIIIDQVLNPQQELREGKLYVVVTTEGDSYVKRLTRFTTEELTFRSDNLSYEGLKLHLKDVYQVFKVALKVVHDFDQILNTAVPSDLQALHKRLSLLEAHL